MTHLPNGANANAIAGGMAALALYNLLVEKGLITKNEARTALADVHKRMVPFTGPANHDATVAAQIIGSMVQRFS